MIQPVKSVSDIFNKSDTIFIKLQKYKTKYFKHRAHFVDFAFINKLIRNPDKLVI